MAGFDGGCACGKVRYRSKGSPFWSMHCHCKSCRRATGSPMASFFGIGRGQVTWTGTRAFYKSTPGVTRGYCGSCGTPLFYMSTRWPGEVHILAATLDDPSLYRPTAHVHWAERLPWLTVSDDLPKHAGMAP
ncbi:MAG: GFA family protein [Pseudomonadota bacterium]